MTACASECTAGRSAAQSVPPLQIDSSVLAGTPPELQSRAATSHPQRVWLCWLPPSPFAMGPPPACDAAAAVEAAAAAEAAAVQAEAAAAAAVEAAVEAVEAVEA